MRVGSPGRRDVVGSEQDFGMRNLSVRWLRLLRGGFDVHRCPFGNRTNITEPLNKYDLSRGYLVSSMLLPSSSESSIKGEIQTLLDLESRFAGFNLLVFVPRVSESEGSPRLSYVVTKLSNNGGGNPIVSRSLTSEERKGGAMSNGIDGKGGDEWPKVRNATRSLREVLKVDFERTGDPDSPLKSDEELAEELFGILSE